jgi:general secretion pathway protein J
MTRDSESVAGFSLIEAMAALALTATIITALGSVAAQWLPNWGRGFIRLQDADLLAAGVERIAADLSAAEFVTQSGRAPSLSFAGDVASVTFVRSAMGPNAGPHLEFVRLAETRDERGFEIVRTRAPFVPAGPDGLAPAVDFTDPVVLVRSPNRLTFSYANGGDRVWLSQWKAQESLPNAVRITVRDGIGRILPASTVTQIHVTASVPKLTPSAKAKLDGTLPAEAPRDGAPPPADQQRL